MKSTDKSNVTCLSSTSGRQAAVGLLLSRRRKVIDSSHSTYTYQPSDGKKVDTGETSTIGAASAVVIWGAVAAFYHSFTGLRPGEKMHEELYSIAEPLAQTEAGRVYRIMPRARPQSKSRTTLP
jgi:hypothetical protein